MSDDAQQFLNDLDKKLWNAADYGGPDSDEYAEAIHTELEVTIKENLAGIGYGCLGFQ